MSLLVLITQRKLEIDFFLSYIHLPIETMDLAYPSWGNLLVSVLALYHFNLVFSEEVPETKVVFPSAVVQLICPSSSLVIWTRYASGRDLAFVLASGIQRHSSFKDPR